MTNKTTTVISNSKPSSYNPVNTERCNWGTLTFVCPFWALYMFTLLLKRLVDYGTNVRFFYRKRNGLDITEHNALYIMSHCPWFRTASYTIMFFLQWCLRYRQISLRMLAEATWTMYRWWGTYDVSWWPPSMLTSHRYGTLLAGKVCVLLV